MADILSESQIGEIQEAFSAVDARRTGEIKTSDLGRLLRMLGQNPTDAELQVSDCAIISIAKSVSPTVLKFEIFWQDESKVS